MVASHGLKTPTAVAEFLVDQLLSFEFKLSAHHDQLATSVKRIVQVRSTMLERFHSDLEHLSKGFVQRRSEQLQQAGRLLDRVIGNILTRKRDHLTLLETRTELVNPMNILQRGYSMTLVDGKTITGSQDVKPGDMLETRLYDGIVISQVEKTHKKSREIHKKDGKREN